LGVTYLTHLECPRCGLRHDAHALANVCVCGSPLLARYDLDAVRDAVSPADIASRPADLWRYRELLPVGDPAHIVSLGEGWTPLLPAPRYGELIGVPRLLLKDEGLLPTGSFKARGAAVGVSRAVELGVRHIAMPTNGNAGAAWAAYAARAGLRATIAVPAAAPLATRRECLVAGAFAVEMGFPGLLDWGFELRHATLPDSELFCVGHVSRNYSPNGLSRREENQCVRQPPRYKFIVRARLCA